MWLPGDAVMASWNMSEETPRDIAVIRELNILGAGDTLLPAFHLVWRFKGTVTTHDHVMTQKHFHKCGAMLFSLMLAGQTVEQKNELCR